MKTVFKIDEYKFGRTDTEACQAAFDDFVANGDPGGTIVIPARNMDFDDTAIMDSGNGKAFCLRSELEVISPNAPSISWDGADDRPMFIFKGARKSLFKNIHINAGNPLKPLLEGMRFETKPGTVSSRNILENCLIDGGTDLIGKGIVTSTGPENSDGNNDLFIFQNCEINNFKLAGVSFEHSQSKGHQFYECLIGAGGNPWTVPAVKEDELTQGPYGVTTALYSVGRGGGQLGNGGSYQFLGGGIVNCLYAHYIGSPNDNLTVERGQYENIWRLIKVGGFGASGAGFPVTMTGVRIGANNCANDGHGIVNISPTGPFNAIGNTIGNPQDSANFVFIKFTYQGEKNLMGNNYNWQDSQANTLFGPEAGGGVDVGNNYRDSGMNHVWKPVQHF